MGVVSRLPIGYAIVVMAIASGIAAAVWCAAFLLIPPAWSISVPQVNLTVASIALAGLLTLLLMIEAVARERLISDAFDPLARHETKRLEINQRVLQNTLEQLPLFGAGVAMIAWLFPIEPASRAIIAATTVWILSRWAFWIGYHVAPHHRVAGLIGSAQSMIILLSTLAVLGWRLAGPVGASIVPGLFSIGELVIVVGLRRRR